MATQVWSGGAGDGVFLTAANWVSGTAPVNGDTAVIGSTSQNIHGAATGLTTLTLVVTEGYKGTIGDDAPLTFASITLLTFGGVGPACNIGCSGTVTAGHFQHGAKTQVNISTGTWTLLTNGYGPVTIANAVVVTTFKNIGGNVSAGYNATAFTTLTTCGGTVRSARVCTTANAKGGTFISMDNGSSNYITNGTVNVENGATYNKQSGGTDTAVEVFSGGTFTVVGTSGASSSGSAVITVTTLTIWSGSMIVDVVPGLTLTVTNRVYVGPVIPLSMGHP